MSWSGANLIAGMVATGLAIPASVLGHPHVAITLLVVALITLFASAETVRERIQRPEKRP